MIDWLEAFYGSETTRDALTASYGPVFRKYADSVWAAEGGEGSPPEPYVESLIDAYVTHHLESSRAQLQEVSKDDAPLAAITERLGEWVEKRPGKVADNETVRASNAVALEAMRISGATEKVWVTAGTCAFCKKVAGKRAALSQPFFQSGDEVTPEGQEPMRVTSTIGHPPLHQGCRCHIEPDGFQQTLGLFPQAEVPLVSNAQRFKYIDQNLRPDDELLAEAWDHTVDVHRVLRDKFIDRDSAWNGIANRTKMGDWGDSAEWDGSISFDLNRIRNTSERFHVTLHESLHHYSADALNKEAFLGYRGWEEGLVEKLTRLYRDDVAKALGTDLDKAALKTWEAATNYNPYITQLEKIRRGLGQVPLDFYEALHAVPMNQRLALVKDLGQSKLASGEWTQIQLDAFLKTVDDAHLVLQV